MPNRIDTDTLNTITDNVLEYKPAKHSYKRPEKDTQAISYPRPAPKEVEIQNTSNRSNIRWGISLVVLMFLTIASFPTTAQSSCYSHDTAYITGNMNIRERPTTSSRVVATARSGDSFSVISSQRSGWCWLETAQGWIAKTSRVKSAQSTNTSPQRNQSPQQPVQQQSNIDNCCFVNRQCNSTQEWTDGYWAYQRNECPVTSQPANSDQTQYTAPISRESGNAALITASPTFYEYLAAGEYTTGTVPLSQGTWHLKVITAATTLAYAESPDDRCLGRWSSNRVLVASKIHNIFGGNNEAEGQFIVTKNCNVRFYVWAPRHSWSLKVTKIG